jgi:formylglycine-generating enzyme required for sulfatase activity
VHTQDEEIELADLGVVFRRVRFEPAIDGNEHLFFSETEITNAAFARYLNDTDQWRDDTGLANAQKRWDAGFVRSDGTTSGQFSTGSPSIEVLRESSLWSEGSFPPGEDDFPVTFLTTAQATAFCDWLTKRYDLKGTFRLPSEQEWLYAAYGKDRDFPWGNDDRDWKSEGTQTVKAKPETRTPDGLYGMWGNASELVSSRSNGYGGQIGKDEQPWITVWLGHNFRDERVRGKPAHPRQDYWGYTHSAKSRSDATGFRVVFDPES